MPDERSVTLGDIAVLAGLVGDVDARTKKILELLAAMADQQQELRARVWITEAFSKAAWRVQMPQPMRRQVVDQFLENLRAIDVASSNPEFAALVHDATSEMLESLGERVTGKGVQ